MSWVYEQSTGRLYSPDGLHVATGYAGGNEGKNPEGVNNHDLQGTKSIGPAAAGDTVYLATLNAQAVALRAALLTIV